MSTLAEIENAAAKLSPADQHALTQFLLRQLEVKHENVRVADGCHPGKSPDFLGRARAVWGERPAGKPLSAVVAEGRGGEA